MERPTYIKFLVSNAAAGSVIGKGGATITDFQTQSGARIQLSRNLEFFPGTTDRIIMISGGINEIIKAMDLVLAKLQSEVHFIAWVLALMLQYNNDTSGVLMLFPPFSLFRFKLKKIMKLIHGRK